MSSNINTQDYWNQRFASGHWERSLGRSQTTSFAKRQARLLRLPTAFSGSLVDFGCGLGDALPIYRERFPRATLFGIDYSEAAIIQCRQQYGHIATFIHGECDSVPEVDVIVVSNVLEHISDDESVVAALLLKCSELYIFVPYRENPLCREHIHSYDKHSFRSFKTLETRVFNCRGWSQYGRDLWIEVYLKNLLRPFFGRSLDHRNKQIMFRIEGAFRKENSQSIVH